MREFKVRVRDYVTGEILTQLYMGQCFQWVNHERQHNVVIEQFTGLKDKNGTEIYEGDIVESDFYLPSIKSAAAVKYKKSLMRFVFDSGEQDAFEHGNLTVIGNIYENKDLLK